MENITKVTVLFERSKDGYYSCFMENDLPDFGLAGYDESAEEAKKDFLRSYEEIREMLKCEGKEVPDLEFVYKYDLQSFFNYFYFLNVSKVAEIAGINPSLMRQYVSGVANAGENQYKKIRSAINRIGSELAEAEF